MFQVPSACCVLGLIEDSGTAGRAPEQEAERRLLNRVLGDDDPDSLIGPTMAMVPPAARRLGALCSRIGSAKPAAGLSLCL
eukprot:COSAG03_NODE_150_length_11507_cov_752.905242_4_plen_81_part_00